MILAAAACAAAGISYIFNDDEQSIHTKYETVTVSSTIVDKQGIVKYVVHPRLINPYSFMFYPEQKCVVSFINKSKLNQLKVPIENHFIVKREFSLLFFWSIPLKARLFQTDANACFTIENLNHFQRSLMKISIGTQNEYNENSHISSEIALSNCDHYSYENTIPIGILKKKRLDLDERENNQKKLCSHEILVPDKEKIMRNMIFKNVNLCVNNLSKILSESCSDTEEQLTTLQKSSSLVLAMNNNNNSNKQNSSTRQDIYKNIHSKLFKQEESFDSDPFYLNCDTNLTEHLSDGVILYRGKQFGTALGEPMIRKSNENESITLNSPHSINELNRLLSTTTCLLMRDYKIESIEDLIRLFLHQGQHQFTQLMINIFKVDPSTVEQLNRILRNWSKSLL